MTVDEIKDLSKKWDFDLNEWNGWTEETWILFIREIQNIERERCAKLCEETVKFSAGHNGQWEGYGPVETTRSGKECAEAIRGLSD